MQNQIYPTKNETDQVSNFLQQEVNKRDIDLHCHCT